MNKHFSRRSEMVIFIGFFIFSILLQILLVPKLPSKYFYDSESILDIANDAATIEYDRYYLFAGNFFKAINILGLKTFWDWAYPISIICSLITALHLFKYKKLEIHKIIFLYITMIFCNIYIYRISKDIIQLIFWVIIYAIGMSKLTDKTKKILIFMVFILEACIFRVYYIATGILFLGISIWLGNIKKVNFKKIIFYIIIGIFIALTILNYISPSMYNRIINMRYSLNNNRLDSADANTAIVDIINSKNVIAYIANYIINLFRILFPIELVLKGIKYIPFIIYQIYFSINLYKNIKKVNKENNLFISIIIAYLLIANLYEPDFGSLIRHEVTLYFIYFELFFNNKDKIKEKN